MISFFELFLYFFKGITSSNTTPFTSQELDVYEELTYLTKSQVCYAFKRFKLLAPDIIEADRMARLDLCYMNKFPELANNPFKDRIFRIFSSCPEGTMHFEDFLDMISVLGDSAPRILKSEYAFKIFDFDGDNELGRHDLEELIRRICGRSITERRVKLGARIIMHQADLEHDGKITFLEFEHLVAKSKEFQT